MTRKGKIPRAVKRIQRRRVKIKQSIQASEPVPIQPVMKGTEFEWFKRDSYAIRGEEKLLKFLNPSKNEENACKFINLKFHDGDEYTINLSKSKKSLDFIYFENKQDMSVRLYSPSGHRIIVNLDYAINIDRVFTVLQLEGLYDRKEYDTLYEKYIEPQGKTSGVVASAYSR
jgi:hypothetical protein